MSASSCIRQDGRINLLDPQMTPEKYNELSRPLGFEWLDSAKGNDQCEIELEIKGDGLTYGEISFLSEEWKEKYTTNDGQLNANFQRALRDVISRQHNTVIYQIVLDRFFNGNKDNDLPFFAYPPENAWARQIWPRMFDGEGANLNKIQGGDLEGFVQKLPYIAETGATAVWLSPIYENALGFAEGTGHYKTKYHGYWTKAFDSMDPGLFWWHRPDGEVNWGAEYNKYNAARDDEEGRMMKWVVDSAHGNGVKVYLDVVLNHTNPMEGTEHGELYYDGKLFCSLRGDGAELSANECYNMNPDIRFGLEPSIPYDEFKKELWDWTLAGLADLNQENPKVMDMLIDSNAKWVRYADGLRIDTLKHVPPIYYYRFVEKMREKKPDLHVFGEWWEAGLLNQPSVDYISMSRGIAPHTMLEFNLRGLLTNSFRNLERDSFWMAEGADDVGLGNYLAKGDETAKEYVTFWNSHDFPRFFNNYSQFGYDAGGDQYPLPREEFLAKHIDSQDQGLIAMFCAPGIPNYYYGDEYYMYDEAFSSGFYGLGGDPFNRPNMVFPEDYKGQRGFKLLQALTKLRRDNPALRFGTTHVYKFIDPKKGSLDKFALAFEREGMGNKVLYFTIRYNDMYERSAQYKVNWPDGMFQDRITGLKYNVKGGIIRLADGDYVHNTTGENMKARDGRLKIEKVVYNNDGDPETRWADAKHLTIVLAQDQLADPSALAEAKFNEGLIK